MFEVVEGYLPSSTWFLVSMQSLRKRKWRETALNVVCNLEISSLACFFFFFPLFHVYLKHSWSLFDFDQTVLQEQNLVSYSNTSHSHLGLITMVVKICALGIIIIIIIIIR